MVLKSPLESRYVVSSALRRVKCVKLQNGDGGETRSGSRSSRGGEDGGEECGVSGVGK